MADAEHTKHDNDIVAVLVRRGDRYEPLDVRLNRIERTVKVQTLVIGVLSMVVVAGQPNLAETLGTYIRAFMGH